MSDAERALAAETARSVQVYLEAFDALIPAGNDTGLVAAVLAVHLAEIDERLTEIDERLTEIGRMLRDIRDGGQT